MKNFKPTDTQLVLLAGAARRDDGSILPIPNSITATPAELNRAIEALLKSGHVAELGGVRQAQAWRAAADQRIGLTITNRGRTAIALEPSDSSGNEPSQLAGGRVEQSPGLLSRGANQKQLIEMLSRSEGASIDEVTAATGWLPHSARAMLTGLKRRGYSITSERVDNVRRYRGVAPAAFQ